MHRPGFEVLVKDLEAALNAVEGVQWAQVNAVLGRVMVAFDPDLSSPDVLIETIRDVEEVHEIGNERFPLDRPEHPGDLEPLRRDAIALGADILGLGASVFGQLLRATPLPVELSSLVSLVDNEPRLRGFMEQHLGTPITDLGLGLSNAFVQALSQGPLGLAVDIGHRANLVRESRERRRSWERRERELHPFPLGVPPPATIATETRATPLPTGPLERYADVATLASIGAFGATLAITGSPRRAASFVVAGLPKAGRMGREAFAASFATQLAHRDVVVLDRAALRRLDRVDTVLLDADVLIRRSELDPLAEALVGVARRGGLGVAVAGGGIALAERLEGDRSMEGGRRLAQSVRSLQLEGHGVLLVSGSGDGLRVSDFGVGITGGEVPWAADVLTKGGLADAHLLVEAVSAARSVATRSALLALAGSGMGSVWSLLGPASSAGRRAALPVNAAALVAQAQALAIRRGTSPPPGARAAPADRLAHHGGGRGSGCTRHLDARIEPTSGRGPPDGPLSRVPPALRLAQAVAAELANPLTPVLAVAAGLAAAVGSMTDAGLVAGVMGVNAVIGGVQRVRAEVSIERLIEVSSTLVAVRRAGTSVALDREELVRGDLVELKAGDVVPADCRILEAEACEVDESVLTGESLPVTKQAASVPEARWRIGSACCTRGRRCQTVGPWRSW